MSESFCAIQWHFLSSLAWPMIIYSTLDQWHWLWVCIWTQGIALTIQLHLDWIMLWIGQGNDKDCTGNDTLSRILMRQSNAFESMPYWWNLDLDIFNRETPNYKASIWIWDPANWIRIRKRWKSAYFCCIPCCDTIFELDCSSTLRNITQDLQPY